MRDQYIHDLLRRAGTSPFSSRGVSVRDKQPCLFHGGDSGAGLHHDKDGIWRLYCRSGCPKNPGKDYASWDAIAFVQKKDGVDFKTAVQRIGGRIGADLPETPAATQQATKNVPLTHAEYLVLGHEPTDEEIATLVRTRKDTTAIAETWRFLGCRVKDDNLLIPYRLRLENGDYKYWTVKTRPLTGTQEDNFGKDKIRHLEGHCVKSNSLFNLDAVSGGEPVYILEGEPDVAIMTEAGYRAVGIMNSGVAKYDPAQLEILCEASEIFLIGDQNQRGVSDPGPTAMDTLAAQLPRDKVRRITFREAKDVCELARLNGGSFGLIEKVDAMTEDARVPWVTKNVPSVNRILRLEDPRWLIEGMIPYKGVTIFCAVQGGLKTTFMLNLCMALRRPIPRPFLGRAITPHALQPLSISDAPVDTYVGVPSYPILYIDRENPPTVIGSRLRRMGLLGDNDFRYWGDDDPNNETPDVTDSRLEEWVKSTCGLIIFDSLQDWYGDAKEIDNSAMVKLMHSFRRLARLGSGVIILHHTAKYDKVDEDTSTIEDLLKDMKKYYRGGTGIVSIPDMAIGMAKDAKTGHLHLGEIRFRMTPEWYLITKVDWDLGDDGRGIKISLVEDMDAKQLLHKRAGRREEKQATKNALLDEDAANVEKAILAAPPHNGGYKISTRELGKVTGLDRRKIRALAFRRYWQQEGDVWTKTQANHNPAEDSDGMLPT